MDAESLAIREERDQLRIQVKTLEREIRRRDKQLRGYASAATDLHRSIEEQEECVTNNILRQRDSFVRRTQVSTPTPPQTPKVVEATDWEARCGVLQKAVDHMRDEVFLHKSRAQRTQETFQKLKKERNETFASAEVRAENVVDRELHKSGPRVHTHRSWSISSSASATSMSDSGETPRRNSGSLAKELRAHTQAVLSGGSATPPHNVSIPPSPSVRSSNGSVTPHAMHPTLFTRLRGNE